MKCIKNTNIKASNVVLGTDSLGSLVDDKTSYELLDLYCDMGGNVLDTAECYAFWAEGGIHASEKFIGKWMKERANRDKIVISTKGGHYLYGEPHRLSEQDIFCDLEGSLKRLNTDYIDIYWLHRDAPDIPVEGIMDTLAKVVKEGKARYIGVSNWTCERIDEANKYADKMGYPKLIASQIQYSPASPNIDKNEPDLVLMNDLEYEYFKNHDLSVFAFAAQAKGFFTKYFIGGEDALSKKAYDRYLNEKTLKVYENIKEVSMQRECSIGNIVVAALVCNRDFDTFPIVGCKNTEQLKDSLGGSNIVLTKQEIDFIFSK